jgi:hypothetical protein
MSKKYSSTAMLQFKGTLSKIHKRKNSESSNPKAKPKKRKNSDLREWYNESDTVGFKNKV